MPRDGHAIKYRLGCCGLLLDESPQNTYIEFCNIYLPGLIILERGAAVAQPPGEEHELIWCYPPVAHFNVFELGT